MKNQIILVALFITICSLKQLNAQVQDTCFEKGNIIHFNLNKCGGCWGWTIALKNDTIKTDELDGRIFGHDFKQPMAIKLTKGKIKSKMGSLPYYEILCVNRKNSIQ